ncbi:MAG: TPM domain-containing protein [Alistipes sp.]|nr:TPM domain-containing protein [Alistipes sp.]
MIKHLIISALALMCTTSLAAQGQAQPQTREYTPQTVPNVQLTDASRFVSNPDGIISSATEAEINRLCLDLRQRQIAEVVVLVLDRVEAASLEMFAHNVLNLWGVGQKGKDNGLVISVLRSQRDIQFETGYGLEGVLPDALCKRIQTVYMVEPLRAGDFDKGVMDGVRATYNVLIDNQQELSALRGAQIPTDGRSSGSGGVGTVMLVIIVLAAMFILSARRNKRGGGRGGDFNNPGGGTTRGRGFMGPGAGSIIGGMLGGMLGGGIGRGFGGGGFGGGGFGGGRSGGGGARSGF